MKYTLLTMFSLNLLLKVVISSSAALMWSLIHVLQVFRYILMINLNMPKIVDILMQYLAVVVGEIDEIEDLVPDWFSAYVLSSNSTELSTNITLYSRFEENGIIKIIHWYRLWVSIPCHSILQTIHNYFWVFPTLTPHNLLRTQIIQK